MYLYCIIARFQREKGIFAPQTCAYTPQQNGVAKRMSRILLDMFGSMLRLHALPKDF